MGQPMQAVMRLKKLLGLALGQPFIFSFDVDSLSFGDNCDH